MQPLSGNQRPDLRTSLMNMSFVPPLPRRVHLCRTSSNVPRLPTFFKLLQNPHVLLTFDKVHNPWRLPRETTSERPKALATWNTFLLFHLQMCLAPQRRTLFRHLNLKNGPRLRCLIHPYTFWLGRVLRATTACTFSTSQFQKGFQSWSALCIFTWKCASRHNGVHFFDSATSKSALNPSVFSASRHNGVQFVISHLASWLRTRRFSEPTFRPSGATNHWKNTVFRDFPTFSRTWIFFLLRRSLFWSSFFFSSLLWLFTSLLFICPYCRKFDF